MNSCLQRLKIAANLILFIRKVRLSMIFLFLVPLYFAVNFYMLLRIFHWTKNCTVILDKRRFMIPVGIVFFLCALSPILAFLLPKFWLSIFIRRFSACWMGVMMYSLMFIVLGDLLRLIIKHTPLKSKKLFSRIGTVTVGSAIAICTAVVCLYGTIHAGNIKTTTYNLTVDKACGELSQLNAVLIADTHMGYAIGYDHIAEMVEKINACNPDIVIFAGDIFDNSIDGLDYPDKIAEALASIQAKYGVWATYGNHDINERILMGFTFSWGESPENDKSMTDFLEKANINLLQDEVTLIDNSFYLVGRRDADKPGTDDGSRKSVSELTEGLDKTTPIFVIDHQPSQLQESADAGADITFSGHTHDGQLFPLNLTIGLAWENPCGVIKKDNMYSVVTSGVGVYGPFMRVGTDAEICHVMITFNG